MECPVCHKPMIILEFNHIEMDFCTSCQGCWLDKGELGLILHGEINMLEDWRIAGKKKSRRHCPRCNGKMRAGLLPGTRIEVDACARNDGLWFDKGELQAIAAAKGGAGRADALADFCNSVFGQPTGGKT